MRGIFSLSFFETKKEFFFYPLPPFLLFASLHMLLSLSVKSTYLKVVKQAHAGALTRLGAAPRTFQRRPPGGVGPSGRSHLSIFITAKSRSRACHTNKERQNPNWRNRKSHIQEGVPHAAPRRGSPRRRKRQQGRNSGGGRGDEITRESRSCSWLFSHLSKELVFSLFQIISKPVPAGTPCTKRKRKEVVIKREKDLKDQRDEDRRRLLKKEKKT